MARKVLGTKDSGPKVDRRKFLTGVAVAGAAGTLAPQAANATVAAAPPPRACRRRCRRPRRPSPPRPACRRPNCNRIGGVAGSDFMVDVIKTLDIKYLPANCASSYRGIHESLINYGGNKMPEFLTCTHEESAVGMAHGYFKVTGKPLLTLVPRHRRPAARLDGDLQRLVRPRAGHRSWAATISTPRTGRRACRPSIRRRTSTRWCATSPSGTTRRCRCSTSRSRSCAPTRFR